MALQRYEAQACQHCHTHDSDWRDPETKKALLEPRWAATTRRCLGCAEIDLMKSTIPDKERGVYVELVHPDQLDEDDDTMERYERS